MEENRSFTVETLLDPPLWREYCTGYRNASIFSTVCGCVSIGGCIILMACMALDVLYAYTFLIAAVPILIHRMILSLPSGKGDGEYRKLVRENGGEAPHRCITLGQEDMVCQDLSSRRELHFDYAAVQKILETKQLLILILKPRTALLLEKRWIRGGSEEELKAFLLEKCPNARNRIRRGRAGRTVGILLTVVLLFGSFGAVQRIASNTMPSGKLHADMSCAEILSYLAPLGISCDDEGLLEELDQYEYRSGSDKVLDLLCWLGYGEMNYDTWEWTPGENGVYWFDAEFIAVDCMYTDFLRGVSALGQGELNFTNIREEHTNVDWYQGTGEVTVTFDWEGNAYQFRAEMMQDWFDPSVLDTVGGIVQENSEKQLFYAFDGGQGYLVFYGDRQWAKDFSSLTGILLETA